jgi:radical SAM protein with 4Fe4S-binding SPASM domain
MDGSAAALRLLPEADCAVIDGTRRLFRVSEVVARWLRDPAGDALPADLAAEVSRLKGAGFWNGLSAARARSFSLGLHLVHGCNHACDYCNVASGSYGDDCLVMPPDVVRAALDFFAGEIRARDLSGGRVVLFGGEPTLSFETVELVVREYRQRFGARSDDLWIVTNGTGVSKPGARFLADHQVLVVLSVDGAARTHDAHRRLKVGQGSSHALAMRAVENLRGAGARFVVRGTWVPGAVSPREQLQELEVLFPDAVKRTVGVDFFADAAGHAEYLASLGEAWDRYASSGYEAHAPASSALFLDLVLRGDWAAATGCEAGVDGFSITPRGDIQVCQMSAADHDPALGNVLRGGMVRSVARPDPGPACADCAARGFCSGPCLRARPLQKPNPSCRLLLLDLGRACRMAAALPSERLAARYQAGLGGEAGWAALQRGAAIRDLIWQRNRHLQPLALCPSPRQP